MKALWNRQRGKYNLIVGLTLFILANYLANSLIFTQVSLFIALLGYTLLAIGLVEFLTNKSFHYIKRKKLALLAAFFLILVIYGLCVFIIGVLSGRPSDVIR
jgi:hypothetical protein